MPPLPPVNVAKLHPEIARLVPKGATAEDLLLGAKSRFVQADKALSAWTVERPDVAPVREARSQTVYGAALALAASEMRPNLVTDVAGSTVQMYLAPAQQLLSGKVSAKEAAQAAEMIADARTQLGQLAAPPTT